MTCRLYTNTPFSLVFACVGDISDTKVHMGWQLLHCLVLFLGQSGLKRKWVLLFLNSLNAFDLSKTCFKTFWNATKWFCNISKCFKILKVLPNLHIWDWCFISFLKLVRLNNYMKWLFEKRIFECWMNIACMMEYSCFSNFFTAWICNWQHYNLLLCQGRREM